MCHSQQPASVRDALLMLQGALGYLTSCDAPGLGSAGQAEVLAGLEQAEAQHTAARAKVLAAFTASRGYQADGQFGPVAWLRGQTRVTKAAAAGAAGWARRLAAHPAVAEALAAGQVTASWARELCGWTDQLPEDRRADADRILLTAAAGGADLGDLGALAQEMLDRSRTSPDQDPDRDFTDRHLRLATTLSGAGRVDGDLAPGCAAALQLVLDALAGKHGPEDIRTLPQRRHDALEEACRRLVASGMLPGRDGQPLRLNVHIDLADLRALPGASELERSWPAARAAVTPGTCHLRGPDAEAAACDATVVPVVTGRIDWGTLDQLTDLLLDLLAHRDQIQCWQRPDDPGLSCCPAGGGPITRPGSPVVSPALQAKVRDTFLQLAGGLLSGPGGLASVLRVNLLDRPYTGLSQPLDLGTPTPEIPPHLRKAVILRDKHCRFPGCHQPPSVCEVHHLIPRSKGGLTCLSNLKLVCRFHHLIAIHRWGWTITCHPDGTTTAHGPGGQTLHSHSPPGQAV
jgi:hypothetical protein